MVPPTATATETQTATISVAARDVPKTSSWAEDVHYLADKEGKVKLR